MPHRWPHEHRRVEKRALEFFGKQPAAVTVPHASVQPQPLWQNETLRQIAFADDSGQIDCRYPSEK